MIPALKAEFRKLMTVRTTYIITGLVVAFVIFIAFYIEGWRLSGSAVNDPTLLSGDVTGALNITVFGAIIAILLMTHEYRYNTIMHTLTSTRNRSYVLLAKIIVISGYAAALAVIVGVLSPLMSYFGIHAHGNMLGPQTLDVWNLAWRSLFYSWGYGMAGLLIAALARSQVASITALFLIPSLGESLLALLLKKNAVYLPFASLNQVISHMSLGGGTISPARAALVFTGYLVIGWILAWVLFLNRDAN
jgi:ABC-type transport system involved in multi-copper enzyme maturation permease subunit